MSDVLNEVSGAVQADSGPAEPTVLGSLPEGFLSVRARELHRLVPNATLIHLPGRREPPLLVSILLHGDETVGLHALQRVLARHAGHGLPRALSIFIGNVAAAQYGVRLLPGGPDYNRIWPGAEGTDHPRERAVLARVVELMGQRGVFASIDLHNNSGVNPHYACVNRLDPPWLHLASLFSRTVVYFLRPLGVQSAAFSALGPAVTCECGKIGDAAGIEHAAEFVDACLHLAEVPGHPPRPGDVQLFHTVASVTVPRHVTFGFGDCDGDLCFPPDLDRMNFQELPAGTVFARRRGRSGFLEVRDERGRDVADAYLEVHDDRIALKRPVIPSMLTVQPEAIRHDRLGYFMEPLPLK
ncbi:M14 family metallopeptidase [Pelomicrobium sp. G1]|uniref:M14 family metallopeptidase n=1 Tax=unclassified Pelomicrobium TaxID=2815318 RepID=UPI003F76CC77